MADKSLKTTGRVTTWFKTNYEIQYVRDAEVRYVDLKAAELVVGVLFPDALLDIAPYWDNIKAWCLAHWSYGPPDIWADQEHILWVTDCYVREAGINQLLGTHDNEILRVELCITGDMQVGDEDRAFQLCEWRDGVQMRDVSGSFVKGGGVT